MLIKKTGKFIVSRALYLALGVFLASAIIVYAATTWDDAKTGGSGQLTEGNWNAFIGMLESEL